jgi:hypothetical protein
MYGTLLAEKLTNAIQNVKILTNYELLSACQITIKNVQIQLTAKGKTTPDSYTPIPKKQLCPKCGCPEMKCFVGAKPLHDRR